MVTTDVSVTAGISNVGAARARGSRKGNCKGKRSQLRSRRPHQCSVRHPIMQQGVVVAPITTLFSKSAGLLRDRSPVT